MFLSRLSSSQAPVDSAPFSPSLRDVSDGPGPWPGSSVGWSFVPIHQGCGFNPGQGMQESTNECMNGWNNELMFLYPPPPFLSLKINKNKLKNLKGAPKGLHDFFKNNRIH